MPRYSLRTLMPAAPNDQPPPDLRTVIQKHVRKMRLSISRMGTFWGFGMGLFCLGGPQGLGSSLCILLLTTTGGWVFGRAVWSNWLRDYRRGLIETGVLWSDLEEWIEEALKRHDE